MSMNAAEIIVFVPIVLTALYLALRVRRRNRAQDARARRMMESLRVTLRVL